MTSSATENAILAFQTSFPLYPWDTAVYYNLYLHLSVHHSWRNLRLVDVPSLECYVLMGTPTTQVNVVHRVPLCLLCVRAHACPVCVGERTAHAHHTAAFPLRVIVCFFFG